MFAQFYAAVARSQKSAAKAAEYEVISTYNLSADSAEIVEGRKSRAAKQHIRDLKQTIRTIASAPSLTLPDGSQLNLGENTVTCSHGHRFALVNVRMSTHMSGIGYEATVKDTSQCGDCGAISATMQIVISTALDGGLRV